MKKIELYQKKLLLNFIRKKLYLKIQLNKIFIQLLQKQKLVQIQLLNLLEFLDLKLISKEIYEKTIILVFFMKNI